MREKKCQAFRVFLFACIISVMCVSSGTAFQTIGSGEGPQFTLYGYIKNVTTILTDKVDYAGSGNDLLMCRTVLRTYWDLKVTDDLRLWSVVELAHEPWYKFEDGAMSSREPGHPVLHDGKEYSEYSDINDVLRELYADFRININNNVRIGRQIVAWGESMQPILDLVHDRDVRFSLGYVYPEETYIPAWLIRTNHNIPAISTSLELIFVPPYVGRKYRTNRATTSAVILPTGGVIPPQRMSAHPDDRNYAIGRLKLPVLGGAAYLPWPLLRAFSPTFPYLPIAGAPVVAQAEVPAGLEDSKFGIRTTSSLDYLTFGFEYFRKPEPALVNHLGTNIFRLKYAQVNHLGLWFNYETPVGGVISSDIGVTPDQQYTTTDRTDADGVDTRVTVAYYVQYQKLLYIDAINKTSGITAVLGHAGTWVTDNEDLSYPYATHVQTYDPNFSLALSTLYGAGGRYSVALTGLVYPRTKSGMAVIDLGFNPRWMNRAWNLGVNYTRQFSDTPYDFPIGLTEQWDRLSFNVKYSF